MSFDYKRWKEQQYSAENDTSKPEVRCPTTIYVVGVIWIVAGFLHLMTLVLFTLVFFYSHKFPDGDDLCNLFAFGMFGIGLVLLGLETLGGTATGTGGSGILSVVFGLVWVSIAVLSAKSIAAMAAQSATTPSAKIITLGIRVVGVALILAGCFAMISNTSYKRWRNTRRSGAGADDSI
jgi:hypothetical protein